MEELRAKKKRIFDIIQIGNNEDWVSRSFDVLLIVMILANLFIAIFSTFAVSEPYHRLLTRIELVTVVASPSNTPCGCGRRSISIPRSVRRWRFGGI